jgi:hypothetical protein
MRRYGVRILVAVLTFLLGVAFSFGLGLFRVRETHYQEQWKQKRDCSKQFALSSHPFTIHNHEEAPLRVTLLGPPSHAGYQRGQILQVLVENTSDRIVSGFSLHGERVRRENGFESFNDTTKTVLKPGQSHITTLRLNNAGSMMELWLSQAEFEDRSTWSNPRNLLR